MEEHRFAASADVSPAATVGSPSSSTRTSSPPTLVGCQGIDAHRAPPNLTSVDSPPMIRPVLALLALSPLALAGNPLPSSTLASSSPRPMPQILTYKELLGHGAPREVRIPHKLDPSQDTLRMRLWTRQWSRLGGQNRSGQPHPGFSFMDNAIAGLDMRFEGASGYAALPGSWNGHFVGQEWGPTEPAASSEWIDAMDWRDECDDNPTCYWGAATYQGPRSYHDTVREYLVPEGTPYYTEGTTPGNTVYFVASGWWDGGEWDGSHAWPVLIEFRQTTILWLDWQ